MYYFKILKNQRRLIYRKTAIIASHKPENPYDTIPPFQALYEKGLLQKSDFYSSPVWNNNE